MCYFLRNMTINILELLKGALSNMPINNITQGRQFMNLPPMGGTMRGPGSSVAGMQPVASNHLNALLMNAAAFVHDSVAQANRLHNTLTNTQSVIDRTSAVSSNTAALRVRSLTGNSVPETSVTIEQVATTQRNAGELLPSNMGSIPRGTHRFEIEVEGRQHTISFTTTDTLTNREFQQQMAAAINSANIGITASVNTAANRSGLNLETTTTGATESGAPRFTIRDIEGNAVELTGVGNITQEAQNAIFTVNGETRTSATNDVNLGDGLAVTLVAASEEEITFTAGRDAAGMQTSVRNIVRQFNDLMEIARDNAIDVRTRALIRDLETVIRRNRRELNEIGVTMNNRGVLTIDEAKLRAAAEDGTAERIIGETNGQASPFVRSLTDITNSIRNTPMRHISNHVARFPGFNGMVNAVANGNTTANEPPSPFSAFNPNDFLGSILNALS